MPFDITNPDSIDAAQKELLEHVEALEKGEKIVTQIQLAGILAESAQTEKGHETQDILNALYGAVSNLQQEMRSTKGFIETIYSESRARMFGTVMSSLEPGVKLSSLGGVASSSKGTVSEAERIAARDAARLQLLRAIKPATESTQNAQPKDSRPEKK